MKPVIRTKLTPPLPNHRTLQRSRLINQLQQVTAYRLTILHAGAGYGKSTTLAQLAQGEAPIVWYHMDAEDADPQVFLSHLVHGFAPHIAEHPLPPLRPPWANTLDALINALAESLAEPLILILDDAHLVDKSLLLLERLLKHAPAHLHVVLAARQMPRLDDLVVWRVRGELLTLTQADLAFTPQEIQQLFTEHYQHPLTPEEVTALHQKTEGWAIALQLIGQKDEDVTTALHQLTGASSDLFDYLAQDVLNQLPEHLRTFMIRSAVLRTMSPAICDCLFEHTNSTTLLRELLETNVFAIALEGENVRYHTLFHEFLYQSLPTEEAQDLHRQAAACYTGQTEEVIYHLLQSGDTQQAAQHIQTVGRQLIEAGRLATLNAWIDRLPQGIRQQHPMLWVYLGDIERLHSRFEDARHHYATAEAAFHRISDHDGTARALRGQGRIYLDTVNPSRAQQYLEQALELAEERDLRANLLELLAENAINRGNSDTANDLQAQAVALRQQGTGEADIAVRAMLRTGKLEQARIILEERAAAERLTPIRRPRAHRETLLLLSLILAFQGEGAAALAAAREGTQRGEQLQSPFVTAVGMMRQGHALLVEGQPAAARPLFEEAIAYSERLGVIRLKAEAFWGLCRAHGRLGEYTTAHDYAQQGIAIAQEAGDDWITAHIQLALGAAYADDDPSAATEWLQQAAEGFAQCGDTHGQAATALWLCWLQKSDPTPAFSLLNGYETLITRRTLLGPPDPPRFVPLLIRARQAGIPLAERLLRQVGLHGIETHPGYRLRVEMLGAFNLWRGDDHVSAGDWPRDKARQMFHIFVTERGKLLDRERIYGLLWPDLDADAAGRSFRVTLNALYKVLEPTREAGAPSAYIVRESSLYGLRPEADIVIDAAQFEEAVSTGDARYPEDSITPYRTAFDLYKGDYCAEYLYEEWLRDERTRLRAKFMRVGERLARLYLQANRPPETLSVCNRMLTFDNCWESAYRLIMRAHEVMGNHAQALRTYHRLAQTLQEELDTTPSTETESLYNSLL